MGDPPILQKSPACIAAPVGALLYKNAAWLMITWEPEGDLKINTAPPTCAAVLLVNEQLVICMVVRNNCFGVNRLTAPPYIVAMHISIECAS